MGFAPALMIHAGTENHVFEELNKGKKTIAELATATGTSERVLRYLL